MKKKDEAIAEFQLYLKLDPDGEKANAAKRTCLLNSTPLIAALRMACKSSRKRWAPSRSEFTPVLRSL